MKTPGGLLLLLALHAAAAAPPPRTLEVHHANLKTAAHTLRGMQAKSAGAHAETASAAHKALEAFKTKITTGAQGLALVTKVERRQIVTDAAKCTAFWGEVSTALKAMTSVSMCGLNGAISAVSSSSSLSTFCTVGSGASTNTTCGSDSFVALMQPIFYKYQGMIDATCVKPSTVDSSVPDTMTIMGFMGGVGIQCMKDTNGAYCAPLTNFVNFFGSNSLLTDTAPTEADLTALCSGCMMQGLASLVIVGRYTLDESSLMGLTMGFGMIGLTCSKNHATGTWCGTSVAAAMSSMTSMPATSEPTEAQINEYLGSFCDAPCVRQLFFGLMQMMSSAMSAGEAGVETDGLTGIMDMMCARRQDGASCMLEFSKLATADSSGMTPDLAGLVGSSCDADITSTGACSSACSSKLSQINTNLGCCVNGFFANLDTTTKDIAGGLIDKCLPSGLSPGCVQNWQAVDFTVTVKGVNVEFMTNKANLGAIGDMLTMDISNFFLFTKAGVVEASGNAATNEVMIKMRALFSDSFSVTGKAQGEDAKKALENSANSWPEAGSITLLSLSAVVPADGRIAANQNAAGLWIKGSISDVSGPKGVSDSDRAVRLTVTLTGMSVADADANGGAKLLSYRKAMASVGGILLSSVKVNGYKAGTDRRASTDLAIDTTVTAASIATAGNLKGRLQNKAALDSALGAAGLPMAASISEPETVSSGVRSAVLSQGVTMLAASLLAFITMRMY